MLLEIRGWIFTFKTIDRLSEGIDSSNIGKEG